MPECNCGRSSFLRCSEHGPASRTEEDAVTVEMPAALLVPSWEWKGAAPSVDIGHVFDLPQGSPEFTLAARVRKSPNAEPGSGRILQKGEPPAGWLFEAPSRGRGVVAFVSGKRSWPPGEEPQPATDEAAAPTKAKAKPKAKSKAGKDTNNSDASELEAASKLRDSEVGATKLDDGEWHHVVVVYSAGRLRAFLDGHYDGEAQLEVVRSPAVGLQLGPEAAAEGEGVAPSEEHLRDVQAFAAALTDAQVAGLASRSKDLPTGIQLVCFPSDIQEYWAAQATRDGVEDESVAGAGPNIQELLSEPLNLRGGTECNRFQDEVICEFFTDFLDHAKEICLTPRKTAVVLGIVRTVFASMYLRSKTTLRVGEQSTVSECFVEFQRLMLAHTFAAAAVDTKAAVGSQLGIFTLPDVRLLVDFVSGSLFQHFLLYHSVLVCPPVAKRDFVDVTVRHPQPPPDLKSARLVRSAVLAKDPDAQADAKNDAADEGDTIREQREGRLSMASQQGVAMDGALLSVGEAAYGKNEMDNEDGEEDTVDAHAQRVVQEAETRIAASIQKRDQKSNGEG